MRRQPLKIVLASYIAYGLYSKLSIVGRIEIECLCLVSICSAVEPHLCVCVCDFREAKRVKVQVNTQRTARMSVLTLPQDVIR